MNFTVAASPSLESNDIASSPDGSAPMTARLTQSPWTLMRQAAGTPAEARAKLLRLAEIAWGYGNPDKLTQRLRRLQRRGLIAHVPTRVQLVIGAADMLRFFIEPAAADYYRTKGIHFGFHQLLRLLDEPASLVDPVGFFSSRDGIIGHLMQVVHANPIYDLQLIQMFDDGLDQLESQLVQMLEGTHPRAASLSATIEEPDYHARLLAYVRAWRADPTIPPLLRSNLVASESFHVLDQTFGSLPAAMAYFCKLPTTPSGALIHLLTVREFPVAMAARPS